MDLRLKQIESFSKRVNENRNILRCLEVNKSYMYDVMYDLDELSDALSTYGNEIKYPIFVDGDQKVLVIRAFEKHPYAKYRLEAKRYVKNKFGEEVNIYSSLDPDFTYQMSNEIMEQMKTARDEGKYYSNELPLPMSSSTQSYLIDNWKTIYNDLLNQIITKLNSEIVHQEDQIERTRKYEK